MKSTAIDTSFDVVYTPKDCTLTIKYQYADGSEAFPPYTGTVKYNGNYSVESPVGNNNMYIFVPHDAGYNRLVRRVAGHQRGHDGIALSSAVMGDMSNLLDAVSSSGEYIQVYISKTLLTLITAGIIIFAAFMALRLALYP